MPVPPKEDSQEGIQLDSTNLGTTSLTNSVVVRNLDQKRFFICKMEKVNLNKLSEYKHMFPDVPTKTNQNFHDVRKNKYETHETTPIQDESF